LTPGVSILADENQTITLFVNLAPCCSWILSQYRDLD